MAKLVLLDVLSVKATVGAAALFFLALIVLVAIGAAGPTAVVWNTYTLTSSCAGSLTACPVADTFTLPNLSPYNQATWLSASIQRPVDTTVTPLGSAFVLPAQAFTWTQRYNISILGDGKQLADTSLHASVVQCMPLTAPGGSPAGGGGAGQPSGQCSPLFIFAAPNIFYSSFVVTVAYDSPTQAFATIAGASPNVTIILRQGFISPSYTSFEVGWKTSFCVLTALGLAFFVFRLARGPGSRDAEGKLVRNSTAQKWVFALAVLLFFFNDPSFLSYILAPSLAISGFYAVSSYTFVCALLLYWLVIFDLARLQGEQGLSYSVEDDPDPRNRPGACFWVPKILIVSITWTVGVAAYMYARIEQASDPSFSVVEVAGPVASWLATFAAGIAGVYVLYIFGLLVLCFRLFRTMRAPNRFVTAVTVTALLFTLVGLFLSSFTSLRETSALFLASIGSANVYVWTLMILHLPVEGGSGLGPPVIEWAGLRVPEQVPSSPPPPSSSSSPPPLPAPRQQLQGSAQKREPFREADEDDVVLGMQGPGEAGPTSGLTGDGDTENAQPAGAAAQPQAGL